MRKRYWALAGQLALGGACISLLFWVDTPTRQEPQDYSWEVQEDLLEEDLGDFVVTMNRGAGDFFEVLRVTPEGDLYVRGELAETNQDVAFALAEMLQSGTIPCKETSAP